MKIKIKKLNPLAKLPYRASEGAAGFDVFAMIESQLDLNPFSRILIPTGLSFELSKGIEIQVRPRSGLAFKNGVTVLNTPGTIDSDYRGELKILLINLSNEIFQIQPFDRIAQIVFQMIPTVTFEEVELLNESKRMDQGFGSTGV